MRALVQRLRTPLRARLPGGLPKGWRDATLQLMLWGLADLLYEGVRGLVTGRGDIALANAQSVVSIERWAGVFVEPRLQHLIVGDRELMEIANWVYLNAQFTVNAVFLAVLYAYRNEIFYFVRNMFFVAMGIALVVHLAVPVAPPRMLPSLGFVDTVHSIAHINQDSGAVSLFVNPYAAVPSMHMCFGLLVGVTGMLLVRRRWLKALLLGYPVVVLLAIVVTANHFLFDAVTGALTALLALLVAKQVMARLRPAVWAWELGPAAPGAAVAASRSTS
ncbi:MAG TPA: phosphatase PAP2 family protein [Solirubrobacteraceae bacterium]|nr:phosphatase PAP2 family protein [Solirubrobacteraceae bacterium]